MLSDTELLERFDSQRLPLEQWHHREHVRVAYLYLTRYGLEGGIERFKPRLQAHNQANGVVDTPTSGYHETMTVAWLRLIHAMLRQYGPAADSSAFWEAHPELSQTKTLRLFYSRERFMSPEAKTSFVEPDLAPLPTARG